MPSSRSTLAPSPSIPRTPRYTSTFPRFHPIHIFSLFLPPTLVSLSLSLRLVSPSLALPRPRRLPSFSHPNNPSPALSHDPFNDDLSSFSRKETGWDSRRRVSPSSHPVPATTVKFPWFFLVPSCVPPHNYRNDSVNSCALSPRSSSRASINLT